VRIISTQSNERPDIVPQYSLGTQCILICFGRACEMNACCIFRPSESPKATVGRSQVFIPTRAGVVLSLLLSVDNVKSSRTFSSLRPLVATCCPKVRYPYPVCYDFARLSTRQRVLTVDESENISRRILRYQPRTPGVSPCAPATMLGLRFKQHTCIFSQHSVVSYVKLSRSSITV